MIQCNNLKCGYHADSLMKPVTFSVKKKDYLLIVGENGCGKTTLMKTLLGLIPAISGELTFDNKIKRIGYLPQKIEISDDFPATVMEVVLSGCLNQSKWKFFYQQKDRQLANTQLDRMGISDLKNQSFQKLSIGQKQKVLLARALCASDQILLLDEPCASLDETSRHQFYDLIDQLNQEMTIIMITHDVQQVIHRCSHVLDLGSQKFFGSKSEYLRLKEGK